MTNDTIHIRPRALEWFSLVLWPPVCMYAAYIALGFAFGVPETADRAGWAITWRRALLVGGAASVVMIIRSVWILLAYGYWTLDDSGIQRGKVARLRIAWDEVDSFVLGMPARQHWFVNLLRRVPTQAVQASMGVIDHHRANTLVLRLRGRRLFPIGLIGRQYIGGAAFRQRLVEILGPKQVSPQSYTDEERRALARLRYARLIQLPAESQPI